MQSGGNDVIKQYHDIQNRNYKIYIRTVYIYDITLFYDKIKQKNV